jgi:transcriptional regulator with XRE-family HTH domain
MSLRATVDFGPGSLRHLGEYRRDVGVTQAELAERAGFSTLTVLRAENGRPVNTTTLVKLADALGVPPSALLEGER